MPVTARPQSFPLDVSLEVDQIVPFAKALLEVFREYGLRQDRQKARFIWLVEDWGVERIREMIAKQMGVSGFERAVPAAHDTPWRRRDLIGIHDQKQPGLCWVGASVPAGRITAEDMFAYADLADRYAMLGRPRLAHWGIRGPRAFFRCCGTCCAPCLLPRLMGVPGPTSHAP